MKQVTDMLNDIEKLLENEDGEQVKERLVKAFKKLKETRSVVMGKLQTNKKLLDNIVDNKVRGLNTEAKKEKRYKEVLAEVKHYQNILDEINSSIKRGYVILFLNESERYE